MEGLGVFMFCVIVLLILRFVNFSDGTEKGCVARRLPYLTEGKRKGGNGIVFDNSNAPPAPPGGIRPKGVRRLAVGWKDDPSWEESQ